MLECKCFNCPLPDCVDPCPYGVVYTIDTDEYILDDEVLKARKKNREYYKDNKERTKVHRREYLRQYYSKNREKRIASQQAYVERNKEKIRAKYKDYYLKNREKKFLMAKHTILKIKKKLKKIENVKKWETLKRCLLLL